MSFRLPNGSTFDLASTYGSAITVSAITNANPAVVTATAHGLANGDIIELTSGWTPINGRLFRIANSDTNTFELEGVDSTDTVRYPAAGGAGTCRKITAFVRVTQVLNTSTSGGEQQFYDFAFLEDTDQRRLPTTRSAQSMNLEVADDSTQAFVSVADELDDTRRVAGMRMNLAGGDIILYNGYASFSKTPSTNRDQLMTRTLTYSFSGVPTRYNA